MKKKNNLLDYKLHKLEREIFTRTIKRKIEQEDEDTESLTNVIIQLSHHNKRLKCKTEWRKRSNEEWLLFNKTTQEDIAYIPSDNNGVFLLPTMKKLKPYQIPNFSDLPTIKGDVLTCIFKKFDAAYELLDLRLVCKEWNKKIINNKFFWHLSGIPPTINVWKCLPLYRQYIQHLFYGCTMIQLVRFLRKNIFYFAHIIDATLAVEHNEVNDTYTCGLYTLTQTCILYKNKTLVSIDSFLGPHRLRLLLRQDK